MSQSLSKIFIHLVFHIKNQLVLVRSEDKPDLYSYIGAIIKDNGSIPIIVNGTDDHLHVFCIMSKNIALAKLDEEIKRHSSRWIKTRGSYYRQFAWQGGYAGFSVSPSLYERTKNYIENQEEHHRKMTFKEELEQFLKMYKIDFDEKYLWSN